MGTFTGGEKLDAYLKELAKKVSNPGTLQVGFPEGSTYTDGTSLPLVAAIQEFGAPAKGIPPRPFMRGTIAKHKDEWGLEMAARLKANGYDGHNALAQMGELIAGQIEESISEMTDPPNAPATVAAKGFAKPLVDTGHMRNSVKYHVVDGTEE